MLTSGDGLDWRKFCGTNNPEKDGCVETAEQGDTVFLRNSDNPDAGTLSFTHQEITNFVQGWQNR
jgi:hypothetical protein